MISIVEVFQLAKSFTLWVTTIKFKGVVEIIETGAGSLGAGVTAAVVSVAFSLSDFSLPPHE